LICNRLLGCDFSTEVGSGNCSSVSWLPASGQGMLKRYAAAQALSGLRNNYNGRMA
jgi:hypothetical protein